MNCSTQFLVVMLSITVNVNIKKTYKGDYNNEVKDKCLTRSKADVHTSWTDPISSE